MARIRYGTAFVLEDEPCLLLVEMNLKAPDQKLRKRYQIIHVIRNDKPAEFRQDLGLAKEFKADQFRIPGGIIDEQMGRIYIEETVGRLKEMADQIRGNPPFNKRELVKSDKIKE